MVGGNEGKEEGGGGKERGMREEQGIMAVVGSGGRVIFYFKKIFQKNYKF